MPTEVRRLIFSNGELYAALDQYLARIATGLPSGSIVRIRTDAVHDVVKIDVSRGARGPIDTVELQARQVGGALIGYCITNQIPLPRGFVKSLIVTGDNIALEMTNSTGTLLLGIDQAQHMSAANDADV